MHREYPAKFPSFLRIKNKPSYKSDKIIGKLYEDCKIFKMFDKKEIFQVQVDQKFFVDGFERYEAEANQLYRQYSKEIGALLNKFGIKKEIELISQVLLLNKKDRNEFVTNNLISRLNEEHKKIVSKFRNLFMEKMNNENELKKKASAWYFVCYEAQMTKKKNNILSFAWIAADYLLKILE